MSWAFSSRSLLRLRTVKPELQDIAYRALELSMLDFGIPAYGGKRTPKEQNYLYESKLSRADGLHVRSQHQTGDALDFFAYLDGMASWRKEHLAIVACAFLQAAAEQRVPLAWGGHWKMFVDMPHVQLLRGGD